MSVEAQSRSSKTENSALVTYIKSNLLSSFIHFFTMDFFLNVAYCIGIDID